MRRSVRFIIILFAPLVTRSQTVELSEDFNNGIPAGWTLIDNDGNTPNSTVSEFTSAWISKEDIDSTGIGDSTAASTSWYSPNAQSDDYLITPQITLGAYGNWLYWDQVSQDASYSESLMILASTTGTNVSDFTDTLLTISNIPPYWTSDSVTLDSSGLTGQIIYLAFRNFSNNRFILHVDNIVVTKEDPSSVDGLSVKPLHIWPNPATDFVRMDHSERAMLSIFSVDGKLARKELYDGSGTLSVANLHPGMYVLELRDIDSKAVVRRNKLRIQ